MKKEIDTTGFSCPQPMLMVKQALDACSENDVTVLADCEASRENITRLAKSMGWSVAVQQREGGGFSLALTR